MANLNVKLVKSLNGRLEKHIATANSLGLRKIGEGTLELTIAGERYQLNAGDSFYFASELPHSYRNTGGGILRVLWVNTPPTF